MANLSNIKVKFSNKDIASIIINEPKTYNALSFKNLNDLIKVFKRLDNNNDVKAIIIEGAGKGFSAGHNLKEVSGLKKREKYQKLFNLCSKLMLQIVEGKKPVIAKVHGAAFAAGCQLVASCDLAYSTNDAIFATPGVNIGLFCSTPMVAVSRKVNRKRMMQMLLTGEPIKANYAKEIGLINNHFAKAKLNNEVLKIAKTIASKSSLTIKIGKQTFYNQLEMPLRKAYAYTSKMMTKNMMAMDAKEGISAFLQKRKPKWKQGVDDNPFDFDTVKKNIEERLNPEFEGRFKVILVPNITNICYGRGVGYKIEEIVLSEEIQKISATKIRAKMREDGKLK